VAERELDKSLPIVTTAEAANELRERGFHQTCPLETWSALNILKRDVRLRITSMPGRQWAAAIGSRSARGHGKHVRV
jgi:hypothetical protein